MTAAAVSGALSPMAEERIAVVLEARSWIGTPFHHAARVKGAGVDCAQLLLAVFVDTGLVAPPPIAEYSADWFVHQDRERVLEVIRELCVPVETPALGDIALYRYGRSISHTAIVARMGIVSTVVHSYRGSGVIEEECGPGSPLASRLAGYWTLARWASPRTAEER